MLTRPWLLIGVLCVLPACQSHTQSTPPLQPTAAQGPAKPTPLEEAGDTAWRVVTAPAQLVAPSKPPPPRQRETYDPPALIMTPRDWSDSSSPSSSPPPSR